MRATYQRFDYESYANGEGLRSNGFKFHIPFRGETIQLNIIIFFFFLDFLLDIFSQIECDGESKY